MKKYCFALIITSLIISCSNSKLKKMSWLKGNWETKGKMAGYHEDWNLDSGIYTGNSYALKDGDTVYAEKIFIRKEGKQIIMSAANNEKDKTSFNFKLTKASKKEFIFVNPLNNFPNEIVYQKLSDSTIEEKISGKFKGKPVENKMILYKGN